MAQTETLKASVNCLLMQECSGWEVLGVKEFYLLHDSTSVLLLLYHLQVLFFSEKKSQLQREGRKRKRKGLLRGTN